jgi:hypothetical protein
VDSVFAEADASRLRKSAADRRCSDSGRFARTNSGRLSKSIRTEIVN